MNLSRWRIAVAAVVLTLVAAAVAADDPGFAEDVPTPVTENPFAKQTCDVRVKPAECFLSGANFAEQYCGAAYLAAKTELGAGLRGYDDLLRAAHDCAKNAEAYLDPMYKATLKKYRGKDASGAIKDFYAAMLATLRGILPQGEETRMTYQARRAAMAQNVRDKRARLELEIR